MLTRLAKLLVFLTFFLAVGLFAWGLSVYTARADTLAKDAGATALAQDEIKRLTALAADANDIYQRRRGQLTAVEARRVQRQLAYADRLKEARNGVLREQVAGPDGVFTDLAQPGRPALSSDGRPLEGLTVLQNKFADETRQIETLIKGTEPVPEGVWQRLATTATPEEVAQVQQSLGIDGLRRLQAALSERVRLEEIALDRTRAVLVGLADEGGVLDDRRVNAQAELQLLKTRADQLKRRLDSLTARP